MRHYLPRRGKRQGDRLRHQPAERVLAIEAERVERTAALLLILLVQRVFASRRAAERRVHSDLLRMRRRFGRDSAATRQRRCGERDDTGQPRHAYAHAYQNADARAADGYAHACPDEPAYADEHQQVGADADGSVHQARGRNLSGVQPVQVQQLQRRLQPGLAQGGRGLARVVQRG